MLKFLDRLRGAKTSPPPVQVRSRITIPEQEAVEIFAIGDIHGRLDLLLAAEARILARVARSSRPALVICLGDFVDRGPESRGVIEHLTKAMPSPLRRICICGNHDDTFFRFLREDRYDPVWFDFGGVNTLLSYGVDAAYLLKMDPSGRDLKKAVRDAVPADHATFLENLPIAVTIGRYLFVHAGIVPGVALDRQSDFDLMWIREPFLSAGPRIETTVVHGHTPAADFQYGRGRIGIDTGAYMTGRLGVLHIDADGTHEI